MRYFIPTLLLSFTVSFVSCKTINELEEQGIKCYGNYDKLFHEEGACEILNTLEDDRKALMCYPYQMFGGNCSWAKAERWKPFCKYSVNIHEPLGEVIFCYE